MRRIFTTKEMVNEIYEDGTKKFICVRDDFSDDVNKTVSVVRRYLCWNGNPSDPFRVVPEENSCMVLWQEVNNEV